MSGSPTIKSVRVRIHGRVQGVWYRAWTVEQATALGLEGWVRNRLDGSVEARFTGPAAAVDRMLEACRDGPRLAVVEHIDVVRTEAAGSDEPDTGPGFRQASTV